MSNMTDCKLLASDLDGTLIPFESDQQFRTSIEQLANALATNSTHLTYVTGRRLGLALEGLQEHRLPTPEYIITDVGTTISHYLDGTWRTDEGYAATLASTWDGRVGADIAPLLDGIDGLSPQENVCQSAFKQSYYVDISLDAERISQQVRDALRLETFAVELIYSIDSLRSVGLLDVLPAGASKRSALLYLSKLLAIRLDEIVYAGDSGNDLEVFTSGVRAILVANTPSWVKQATIDKATAGGFSDRIFIATTKYASGVLEGCRHFNVIT
jgi:sucrose-6F-phosphate phosphohydrolase